MKIILFILLCVYLFASCFDDEGNYDYKKDRGVYADINSPTVFLGEEIDIQPQMYYGMLKDTMSVSFQWFVKDTVISTDRILHYKGEVSEEVNCYLYVTDNGTGITSATYFKIYVRSPYSKGWAILNNQHEQSEIAHVAEIEKKDEQENTIIEYKLYKDVYKSANSNEELGGAPVKLMEHYREEYNAINELLVIQRGGQGCVELDGATLKKVITTKQEFIDEKLPDNFAPRDIIYLEYVHFIWNNDGKLYNRLVGDPKQGFHISAFNNQPMYVEGDMRVDNILYTAYFIRDFVLLYDGLNKCLRPYGSKGSTTTGNIGKLIMKGSFPEGFTRLDDFGDMELIYGGSFKESGYSFTSFDVDFSMLLKKPTTGKYYWQTFNVNFKHPDGTVAGEKCSVVEFPRGDLLHSNSLFWLFRGNRKYMFFTGGINNDQLYYYDTAKKTVHLYKDFEGNEITAIHPNKGCTQIGVGLKNGVFTIFDVTDATFISGQPKILYGPEKICNGEIVDVIYRYNKTGDHWN